jgi:diaminohydroxyphosphoribosylaminopyrimidine deaminase/5-amino-6-(5-phosphoribosylamino)uracil reductase
VALDMAGLRARGSTMYCTLEPCCHMGRTGPCVERIADAGVSRVVAAVADPNPLVNGRGFAFLEARGIKVDVGMARAAAVLLNQPFFTLMNEGRPFVTLKAAVSADGYIAEAPGQRTALTSEAANRHAQRIRAEIDAIGVGVGTILADDPLLTARGAYRELPLVRVIFDRRLRTPPTARVLSAVDGGPVMIMTAAGAVAQLDRRKALEDTGATIVTTDGTIAAALRALGERNVTSLLLEGGAMLHAAAWNEQMVDYVRLYSTPHTLGPGGVKFLNGVHFSASDLVEPRRETLGPDVMTEGYVHGPR